MHQRRLERYSTASRAVSGDCESDGRSWLEPEGCSIQAAYRDQVTLSEAKDLRYLGLARVYRGQTAALSGNMPLSSQNARERPAIVLYDKLVGCIPVEGQNQTAVFCLATWVIAVR